MREVAKDYEVFPGEYPVVVVASLDSAEMDVTEVVTKFKLNPTQTVWVEHIIPEKVHFNDFSEENWSISSCQFSRDRYVLTEQHILPEHILKALITRC
jgi:hypothetical protein